MTEEYLCTKWSKYEKNNNWTDYENMKWNKIEDVRPSEGETVIAFSKKDGINYNVYFCFGKFGNSLWQRSGCCNMEDVTHWMNQPKIPGTWNKEI